MKMLALSRPNNDAASIMSARSESEMRRHERQREPDQAEDCNGAKVGELLGVEDSGGLNESGHFSIPQFRFLGLKRPCAGEGTARVVSAGLREQSFWFRRNSRLRLFPTRANGFGENFDDERQAARRLRVASGTWFAIRTTTASIPWMPGMGIANPSAVFTARAWH
jgi:hypothetical protein